jgi:hypothetical protein
VETRANLDVLMLTQGYRRYDWKKILDKNRTQPAFQPEKTLSLTGVVKTSPGKPAANRKVVMAVNKLGFFKDTVTDVQGYFTFRNLDLPDSARALFNAGEHNQVTVLQKQYLPGSSTAHELMASASPEIEQSLANEQESYLTLAANDSLGHVHMLKEITVKERKPRKEPDLTGSANLNGPGHADQIIMDDQLDNCISLADCLNGKLHFIYENGGIFFAQRYQNFINVNSSATVLPSMVIIVDGSVMDSSYIGEVNAKDVKSVEVLISGGYLAIYGTNAPFGALIITTKHGSSADSSTTVSTLSKYNFNGFTKGRVFYSPKYDHQETAVAGKDLRSTIYWEPYLITGKNGKVSFDYYNAEAKGTYKVVIEGIDINGRLGRMVYRYIVQ